MNIKVRDFVLSGKYKFPGFQACMKMMRSRDPQTQEEGFYLLLPHASEFVEQLIVEFHAEENHGLRCWLLEFLGESKSNQALPVLQENLYSKDESFKSWAIYGLKKINTKESRRMLWEAGAS